MSKRNKHEPKRQKHASPAREEEEEEEEESPSDVGTTLRLQMSLLRTIQGSLKVLHGRMDAVEAQGAGGGGSSSVSNNAFTSTHQCSLLTLILSRCCNCGLNDTICRLRCMCQVQGGWQGRWSGAEREQLL